MKHRVLLFVCLAATVLVAGCAASEQEDAAGTTRRASSRCEVNVDGRAVEVALEASSADGSIHATGTVENHGAPILLDEYEPIVFGLRASDSGDYEVPGHEPGASGGGIGSMVSIASDESVTETFSAEVNGEADRVFMSLRGLDVRLEVTLPPQ